MKTISECRQILEMRADLECIGDNGPPYCDDNGNQECFICAARSALNEVGKILRTAVGKTVADE
ncbi:hypothetical protein LCGC14_0646730 [marine sediment metagenome]|uniref:Uncharacterized protein n=1 Tax=marine sediment metagenome TaxID=412755 RepID=A0A0F9RH23_9ZZZZ|nr:hypothetical protein [Pricia sp.]